MIGLILEKTAVHFFLTLVSLMLAMAIALPLAVTLTRTRHQRLAKTVLRLCELIQTIPGLAMLASIVVFLAATGYFPITGPLPAIATLVLYALAPILTSTYTGIRQISPALIEVGQGMGMTPRQVLFMVEIPTSIPMIAAGVRIAAVWTVGMATLTSLVGAGGLGDLIMQGLRTLQPMLVLAGTIPALLLALFYEWSVSRIEKWLVN